MRVTPEGKLAEMLRARGREDLLKGFTVDEERVEHFKDQVEGHYAHLGHEERLALAIYMAHFHVGQKTERPKHVFSGVTRTDWFTWAWRIAILVLLALILAMTARAQVPHDPILIRLQNAGSTLATRQSGVVNFNCLTNLACSWSGSTFTLTSTGGPPSGAAGGILSGNYPNPGMGNFGFPAGSILFGAADGSITYEDPGLHWVTASKTWNVTGQLSLATPTGYSGGIGVVRTGANNSRGAITFQNATGLNRLELVNDVVPLGWQFNVVGDSLLTIRVGGSTVASFDSTGVTATTFLGSLIGNASTATALAADPANCAAGSVAAGVNAPGTAEGCVAATNLNTPSTIVQRDGSGDFSAGTITASLTGNASGSAGTVTSIASHASTELSDSAGLVRGAASLTTSGRMVSVSAAGTVTEQAAITAAAGVLTATGFSGPLTGNVTGNVSGSAGTVTSIAAHASTELSDTAGLPRGAASLTTNNKLVEVSTTDGTVQEVSNQTANYVYAGPTSGGAAAPAFRALVAADLPADPSWVDETLQNGWTNSGGGWANAGHAKNAVNTVFLRGKITAGTIADGTLLFTLPVGSRPGAQLFLLLLYVDGVDYNNPCAIYILTTGEVYIYALLAAGSHSVYLNTSFTTY